MKLGFLINFTLFALTIFIPITHTSSSAAWCNHTCGDQSLHFPFGFSAGCQIQLNCSSAGVILAADLPVQSVDRSTILVSLPAMCGRPVAALHRLLTNNFAPTSHNAILLRDCKPSHNTTNCFIPQTMVRRHFELLDCGGAGASAVGNIKEKRGAWWLRGTSDLELLVVLSPAVRGAAKRHRGGGIWWLSSDRIFEQVWIWTKKKEVMTVAVERGWNTFIFHSGRRELAAEWSSIALLYPLFIEETGIFDGIFDGFVYI
ncbi:hypothetical protein CASFOL_021939 [Castilleja foliolosa]|uniref:3-dehydroquinate synthase N-terminal domain-containing protein n=1 Tax=Castilleja foliolosa TaxID=1961234 RepID=A0ABD3D1S7_9LAMI